MNYETDKQKQKDYYYLGIAEAVAAKSTCMRRLYGAIIVKNDEIISTGYNGSPRGALNCNELGCVREAFGTKKGDAYNLCASVHAEQNAIISASRRDMIGSTLYIVGINVFRQTNFTEGKDDEAPYYADPSPCLLCHRMIVNAGITRAVGFRPNRNNPDGREIIEIDISGHRLMQRIQREYIALLETQEKEFEINLKYHENDLTPKEKDEERERLSRIRNLIEMRQLFVDGRGDEVDMIQAEKIMRDLTEMNRRKK